ncbi:hypothetical protein DENSPDRAFT_299806 [Dentipellis sp. KUC8613]|nr:hypothetical protein DENSPDRAFT_299806 [Dentipellis sp. KUC8613]
MVHCAGSRSAGHIAHCSPLSVADIDVLGFARPCAAGLKYWAWRTRMSVGTHQRMVYVLVLVLGHPATMAGAACIAYAFVWHT